MMLLILFSGTAFAGDFAALSVQPYGDQVIDIATSITTLPDGGEVIDRDSGVSLTGAFVRYQEGVFVEASGAEVTGDFGTIAAPEIYLDIDEGVLRASAGVLLLAKDISVNTDALTLYLDAGMAVASGNVVGQKPPLESATLLIDITQETALLLGPYVYQDGPITLRGNAATEQLLLSWTAAASGESVRFEASTVISEDLNKRFSPFLP